MCQNACCYYVYERHFINCGGKLDETLSGIDHWCFYFVNLSLHILLCQSCLDYVDCSVEFRHIVRHLWPVNMQL